MTDYGQNYREIITKAVCGNGKKRIQSTDEVMPNQHPSSVLGCWVINHEYRAKKIEGHVVQIEGSYDINVWYSFQENTKTEVVSERVAYCDDIPLSQVDEFSLDNMNDVTAEVMKQPNCIQCSIAEDKKIHVEIEREFAVEVIGETKVKVQVIQIPVKTNPSQTPAMKRVK